MQNTNFVPGQSIFSNGQITGNEWGTPTNIFLVDQQYATSDVNTGSASDFIVGNFNLNLPQDAVPTGIEIEIIGHRGAQTSPVISLDVSLYDDTNGASNFYPYTAPITSLTTADSTIVIGGSNYLFASSFTVDQINNMKLAFTANGDISLDSVQVKVYYFIQTPPAPPVIIPGVCVDCSSPIQVQAMYLELPFLIGETKFYLKKGSFSYPNGIPVQPGDVGSCGGTIPFVFDESKRKMDGQNFEENAMLDTNNGGTWTVLPSGVIEVDLGFVTQRGLDYKTPAAHIASNMSDHDANSKVIISNNEPYNLQLLRTCQVNTVFSPPIYVKDENAYLPTNLHDLDFRGAGVSAINDGIDPFHKIIIIPGVGGTTPPVIVSVTSNTSGNTQVTTLTALLQVSGLNRGVAIQISTEQLQTVVSVDVGGTPATQEAVSTDVGANLRSESWFCQNPPLGPQLVTITLSGAAYLTFGAECINGVDPVAPVGTTQTATGTSLNPTLALITGTDYSLVVDGLATAQTPILYTPGAGQANNWNIVANTSTRQGGSSVENAGLQPDNITMDYAITQNTVWCYTAIEVKGITTAVPGSGQTAIQFQDEGVNLGAPGTVDTVDFTGAGVTATRVGNVVTVNIPGGAATDEKVSVSAADTTPGFLQPKLNVHSSDGSVIVTPTITNPAGNEILDIDLTGAGGGSSSGGGSMSAGNVTLFDDFVSSYLGKDAANPNMTISGNFGGEDITFILAELDHPGIARIDTSGQTIIGFSDFDETGTFGVAENLTYDNNFDITFLSRLTYNGTFTVQWQLFGTTNDVTLEITDAAVSYDVGAGVVPTAVPVPATTVWFQPRFVYNGGTLTIYIDSTVVFTGAVSLADSFQLRMNIASIGGGDSLDFDTDYVVTKYQTSRTSPVWGGGNGFPAQQIALRSGTNTIDPFYITSNPTGDVIYIAYVAPPTTTTANILRLVKDPLSGSYYITHSTTLTVSANGIRGLAVAGNFLYVGAVIAGNSSIRRYAASDLTGVTTMTGVTPGTLDLNMWSDGVDLFTNNGADTYQQYTIAGTVVTDVGAVVYTTSGNPSFAAISDGNFVWITDGGNAGSGNPTVTVRKYAITGGAVLSTTTYTIPIDVYPGVNNINLFMGTSAILAFGWGFNNTSQSAVTGISVNLFGLTLP